MITNFDFDGNWNGKDNWENAGLTQYYENFHAYVYYAIIESESHYFITYMFFHPRDTGTKVGGADSHENDSEGCRVIVEKDGSYWGRIQRLETIAHEDYYTYWNPNLINGSRPAVFVLERKHAVYGTNHAESEGDCWICFSEYLRECQVFPSCEGTGVGYWYAGRGAEAPTNLNDRDVSYELINIESTLWPRRFGGFTYRNCADFTSGYYWWDDEEGKGVYCHMWISRYGSRFRGDNFTWPSSTCRASAPWAYPFEEYPYYGKWFLDPLWWYSYNWCGVGEQYVYNPYISYDINCPPACD